MAKKHVNGRRQAYVAGSAARELNPYYEVEYENGASSAERRRAARKRKQERLARKRAAQRNQSKASYISAGYVVCLAFAAIATLLICINYLRLNASITSRMDSIAKLQLELEHQKTANDELRTAIDTACDLNHVYQVATQDLGMVYANQNQILLYDKTESEYVRQNEDIPEH
ncbi:MAG: cell division protein FtsL [Bacillota bacterium]|uniref:Cell division protein FtsL n=1 Tax=[Clostridium] aminophilum TaxID=1526 RepID=A0A1I6ISB5_9FIRM|nr:hypothetical protein [[Clostridium] aminophilum]MCR4629383.1 cell division protein FtsL [Clostridium sp.]MDT3844511.1 cell division protein FtsL [Bacillota bacterium]SFR69635.1 hypothetical protein SAMN02910262_00743 [[Clostridium] aminophilum]